MAELRYVSVVGRATQTEWSQVIAVSRNAHGMQVVLDSQTPALFLASNFYLTEEDEGRRTVEELSQTFLEADNVTASSIKTMMESILAHGGLESAAGMVFIDRHIFIFGFNGGTIYVKRGGKSGKILTGKENDWTWLSGEHFGGDRWMLATGALAQEMTEKLEEEVLHLRELDEAGEEWSTRVQAGGDTTAVAGVLIEEEQKKESEADDEDLMVSAQQKPTVFLRGEDKRKKIAFSTTIILLILLAVSLFFGWQKRQQNALADKYLTLVNQVDAFIGQAEAVSALNKIESGKKLDEALMLVTAAEADFAHNKNYSEKVNQLKARIEENKQRFSGEKKMGDVPVWYDLTIIRADMFGETLRAVSEGLVVYDQQRGLVGLVPFDKKEARLVGGGDLLTGGKDLTYGESRAYALASKGLVEVNPTTKTTSLAAGDEQALAGKAIELFGANVYVVTQDKIWRYAIGSWDNPVDWLAPGVDANLGEVADMKIDGDIWLLYKDGEVGRFRRGSKEAFKANLPGDTGETTLLDISGESELLYILDQTNKRVMVLNKEGEYQKQYAWEGLAGVTDMAVVEDEGSIFLLSGSSIYLLPL